MTDLSFPLLEVRLPTFFMASRSLGSRLLLQSFDVRTLKYVHEKYPNIRLLYLVDKSAGSYGEAMARIGFTPYAISPDFPMITQDFVSKAKAEGMRVIPYTVDTKEATLKMKRPHNAVAGRIDTITHYTYRKAVFRIWDTAFCMAKGRHLLSQSPLLRPLLTRHAQVSRWRKPCNTLEYPAEVAVRLETNALRYSLERHVAVDGGV